MVSQVPLTDAELMDAVVTVQVFLQKKQLSFANQLYVLATVLSGTALHMSDVLGQPPAFEGFNNPGVRKILDSLITDLRPEQVVAWTSILLGALAEETFREAGVIE